MEISLCVSDLRGPPAIQLWERISLTWSPEAHRSLTHLFKWFAHEGQPMKRIWLRSDRWWTEGQCWGLFWKLLYTSPTIMCWTTEGLVLKIFKTSIWFVALWGELNDLRRVQIKSVRLWRWCCDLGRDKAETLKSLTVWLCSPAARLLHSTNMTWVVARFFF